MSRPRLSLGPLALSLLAAAAARADVVVLKDGRTVEGAIVERSSTALTVRQRLGEVRLELSQVASVTEQDDPWDQLQRLRSELGQGTADERYRLATFAREHDFADDARRAFLDVLRVDPDHPGARAALGFVRVDGRWVTVEDKARGEGLVPYRGRFVTPEEKDRLEFQARAEAAARRAAREQAVADARAKREAEREARRARIAAYEEAVAKARAREEAMASAMASYDATRYGYGGIVSTYGGYWGWPYGPVGVVSPGWSGWCPPRPVPYHRPGYGAGGRCATGWGVSSSGFYNGGNWGVRWRVGF